MQLTKYSLLVTCAKIIEKYKGNYSYASTATILDLLKTIYKINIGKRTYYEHMADLRKSGLIKSIRRYGRKEDGKLYNRTSAVCITIKGYIQLASRGWKWAWSMVKKLKQKVIPEKPEPAKQIIAQNTESEKKEADTLKEVANQAIKEGLSLWDYVRSDKLKLPR